MNDRTTHPVEVLPTPDMLVSARTALKARLAAEGRPCGDRAVTAVYARGGGGATPLALPELLAELRCPSFGGSPPAALSCVRGGRPGPCSRRRLRPARPTVRR
ncbi:MAG: hypothetical protein R2755_07555 [Acidimicrobiales bacterium]